MSVTPRVQKFKDELLNAKLPICAKKFEIAQKVMKANPNDSEFTKRSKVLAAWLREIPIFIEDGDMFCGAGASKPNGVEIEYSFGLWPEEELESLQSEDSLFYVPNDDLEIIKGFYADSDSYVPVNLSSLLADVVCDDERLWNSLSSGVQLPTWRTREEGLRGNVLGLSGIGLGPGFILFTPDFGLIMRKGARAYIDEAKEHLKHLVYSERDVVKKKKFYEGVIMTFEAWVDYAHRYAELADNMAQNEADPVRAEELHIMADICRRVPEFPAQSFREAMQFYFFIFNMLTSPTNSVGRFDQFMYPYYRHDLETGAISKDDALEMLEIMRIKIQKFNTMNGSLNRSAMSGNARWYNHMLGGVDKDGNDATNELSYLMLDAAEELGIPHPTLTVRVHKNSPREFLDRAVEVLKKGMGLPAFVSDDAYIGFFVDHGFTAEEARDYCCTGCLDGNVVGKTRIQAFKFVNIPMMLDIYMHRGVSSFSGKKAGLDLGDPCACESFEEFRDAFYREMDYFLHAVADVNNVEMINQSTYFADPFRSAVFDKGLELGRDFLDRTLEPFENGAALCITGGINAGDALAAIKKLVFEEKKYTMQQLIDALDANWQGYEDMRKDFKTAPKFGNNNDYVDDITAELYDKFSECCLSYDQAYGGKVLPVGISISAHQPSGMMTPATPEGRFAGEIMADGSISPEQGCDVCGPLAVFQSGMKINQRQFNATLLNQKFHPSALASASDVDKLAGAIQVYLTNGGKHVQFNVVDRDTLLEAKAMPEKHRELLVRVAGYSAYFTTLSPMMQDEVIDRTTFDNVS